MINELNKVRTLLKLKEVNRYGVVKDRQESSAEHSWSCMVLADYFLEKYGYDIDRTKVMDLLLYHDLVEIESGDTYFLGDSHKKEIKEEAGFKRLLTKIPPSLEEKYSKLHIEFIDNKTPEAKFAHAVDKLEALIHFLDYKELWLKEGYDEKLIRKMKEPPLKDFPELQRFLEDIIDFLKKNKFF